MADQVPFLTTPPNHNHGEATDPSSPPTQNPLAAALSTTTSSLYTTFSSLNPRDWIRLIIIVGSYMLLRRLVVQHIKLKQRRDLDAADRKLKADAAAKVPSKAQAEADELLAATGGDKNGGTGAGAAAAAGAGTGPGGAKWTVREFKKFNQTYLTDRTTGLGAGAAGATPSSSSSSAQPELADWGSAARLRHRTAIEQARRELEEKYRDADSDEEIAEFLID